MVAVAWQRPRHGRVVVPSRELKGCNKKEGGAEKRWEGRGGRLRYCLLDVGACDGGLGHVHWDGVLCVDPCS